MTSDIDLTDFDGLLFDCDGTLALTAPVHLAALTRAIGAFGFDFDKEFYLARTGHSLEQLLEEYTDVCGVRLSSEEVAVPLKEAYCAHVELAREIAPVVAVVRANAGIRPMAVVSSSMRKIVLATLDYLQLTPLFQDVVTVEDVVNSKPAPDAYLLGAARIGVAPARCLVFEDSEHGLAAAKAAGMKAIDIRTFTR